MKKQIILCIGLLASCTGVFGMDGYTIQYVEKDPKNKDHQTHHKATLTFLTQGFRAEDKLLTKCGNSDPIEAVGQDIVTDMERLNELKGKQVIVISQGSKTTWYSNLDPKDHANALLFCETRNKCGALKMSNGDKMENFCKVKKIAHPFRADRKAYLSTDYLIFPTMMWQDSNGCDISARIELSTIMNLYKIISNDGLDALDFGFTSIKRSFLLWRSFEKKDIETFFGKMVLKAGTFAAIVAALCYYCKSK
jgi:hypothetical protein